MGDKVRPLTVDGMTGDSLSCVVLPLNVLYIRRTPY